MVILRDQGKFSEAKDMYQNAIQHKPDYAIAWLNLGILYDLYLQDLPNALTQYNTYQKLTGNQDKVVEKWIIDLDGNVSNQPPRVNHDETESTINMIHIAPWAAAEELIHNAA